MLEAGAIILTVSSGVTLIIASFTLVLILILKKNAPIIFLVGIASAGFSIFFNG